MLVGSPNYIGYFQVQSKDGSDIQEITRFSNRKWVSTCAMLEIWEYHSHPSDKLEKWQHKSDPPNIKYNYAVLFLRQIITSFCGQWLSQANVIHCLTDCCDFK